MSIDDDDDDSLPVMLPHLRNSIIKFLNFNDMQKAQTKPSKRLLSLNSYWVEVKILCMKIENFFYIASMYFEFCRFSFHHNKIPDRRNVFVLDLRGKISFSKNKSLCSLFDDFSPLINAYVWRGLFIYWNGKRSSCTMWWTQTQINNSHSWPLLKHIYAYGQGVGAGTQFDILINLLFCGPALFMCFTQIYDHKRPPAEAFRG